jgi:hypothetical protein
MQVNSAQDYLTRHKRNIIAKTYAIDPPAGKNKIPSTYLSLKANGADQVHLVVAAACRGNNTCSGLGKTTVSYCCGTNGQVLY